PSGGPARSHHCEADSPEAGIIGATRTSARTDNRAHTSGAVKAPNECETTTTSRRSPTAETTVSAYSASPAERSSHGRRTAVTAWPKARSSRSTRCQYHGVEPAPGRRTNIGREWVITSL